MSLRKPDSNRQPLKPVVLRQFWQLALWAESNGRNGRGTQPGDVDYTVSTTRFTTHGIVTIAAHRKIWPMPNWAYA